MGEAGSQAVERVALGLLGSERAMDKPISVGDLVVVVKSCCGRFVGLVATVKSIDRAQLTACGEVRSRLLPRNRATRQGAMRSRSLPVPL